MVRFQECALHKYRTGFHFSLQSVQANSLCVPLHNQLQENAVLDGDEEAEIRHKN